MEERPPNPSFRNNRSNVLIEKIDQAIRNSGDADIIRSAAYEHLQTLADFLEKDEQDENSLMTQEEINSVLLAHLFFQKMSLVIPKKRVTCQVDENTDWVIPLRPLEEYRSVKSNEDFRKNIFLQCLEVGDILDCQVVSVHGTHYILQVIHKYGALQILDDLNITVVLPVDAREMSLLSDQLLKFDLIRVAVRSIPGDPKDNMTVTLDETSFPIRKGTVKLGKITRKDLPSYVQDSKTESPSMSYIDYLNSFLQFKNHVIHQEMTSEFGIDPYAVQSFFTKYDSLQCSEDFIGETLLKVGRRSSLTDLLESAAEAFRVRNFKLAENLISSALKVDPECREAYMLKARIFAHADKPMISRNMVVTLEKVFRLNENDNVVRGQLSEALFGVAYLHYKKKNYGEACKYSKKAQKLNPRNVLADELLDYLKLKHPEAFQDYDNASLPELQATKKKIVTQLKQMEASDVPQNIPVVKQEKP